MRMMLHVTMPPEPFNAMVRNGTVGQTIKGILDELKPEAAYFTEQNGKRGATLILNVSDPSQVPGIAEPFFLKFSADCQFRICMTPEDLAKAGLDKLGKKWA